MHVGEMGLPDRGIIDKPNKVETWCKTCTENSAFWLHEWVFLWVECQIKRLIYWSLVVTINVAGKGLLEWRRDFFYF